MHKVFLLVLVLAQALVGCTPQAPTATEPPAAVVSTPTPRATLTPEPTLTRTPTLEPTATRTPVLAPAFTATQALLPSPVVVCPDAPPSYLAVGKAAMVSLDPPLASRLRAEPGLDAKLAGQADAGQLMEIIAGPECADGFVWWQVRLQGSNLVGWTVEGDATGPWLITPTPAPTLTATPVPGQCPPFPVQTSLPNPVNAADVSSYLGKIFNKQDMPAELQFQRGTVVDLEKGYTVIQVQIKASNQTLLWLEKMICRDTEGRVYAQVTDVYLLPPLRSSQFIAVSSVDRCEMNGEHDPYLVALGELPPDAPPGVNILQNLERAWRVSTQTDRMEEIPLQGLACSVYTGGP